MSMNGAYHRPTLKPSVDIQLQNAFSEGNWMNVVRLADKRVKSTNDTYYKVVKACAEAQLDGPLEKCAAIISIDSFVQQCTVPKDAEALDLYEWACHDVRDILDYPSTLGLLRSRWVKVNPRSPHAIHCLKACIRNWDLVNAQQIAATLDKALTSQRHFMFWNIILTYLLSTSDQCPPDKQKIYTMLVMKQLERAAEITGLSPEREANESEPQDRGLRTHEEVVLFYRLLAAHGTSDSFLRWLHSPALGALRQFDEGRKHLLLEAVSICESQEQWDAVFELCIYALRRKEQDGSPSFFSSNWAVWKSAIGAASKTGVPDQSFAELQALAHDFAAAVQSRRISPMFVRNIGLALVELTFSMQSSIQPALASFSTSNQVAQIALFLDKHGQEPSAFDDIKGYTERLSFEEGRYLLDDIVMKRIYASKPSAQLASLYVKLRYLLTTCLQTLAHVPVVFGGTEQPRPSALQCKYCATKTSSSQCEACLSQIAGVAMDLYAHYDKDSPSKLEDGQRDPNIDLALVAAMCLLKLSGFFAGCAGRQRQGRRIHFLLQALIILDCQHQKRPNDPPLRLLLSRLYLTTGCASYARQLWTPLGVKRTIHDSLSPLFFDRIASISPGLFAGMKPLMEPLRSHYTTSLRHPSPVKIWDAFEAGSYSSVLEVTDYCDRLRRSTTLVMTVVEERRAIRALGGRLEDLENIQFLGGISKNTKLVTALDYGSIPDFESSLAPRLADMLSVGPPPSNTRSHLDLLAEQFLQLCTNSPLKDYKPKNPYDVATQDLAFLRESLELLHESFTDFLHLPDTASRLTRAEEAYYTSITLMSGLMSVGLSSAADEKLPASFGSLAASIRSTVASFRVDALTHPASTGSTATVLNLSNTHSMAMLRETAFALTQASALLMTHHEREASRDRTGKSNLHKDVLSEIKSLAKVAADVMKSIRDHVKRLRLDLGEPGLTDLVVSWAVGEGTGELAGDVLRTAGGRSIVEAWARKVIESWKEGVKGWSMTRME